MKTLRGLLKENRLIDTAVGPPIYNNNNNNYLLPEPHRMFYRHKDAILISSYLRVFTTEALV
jgi:hypothetical protein